MFSIRYFLLCLVALSTSIVSALPVTPSSSTSHDLPGSETPTRILVSRQEGNPQRQLFCHYNPLDCQRDFPEYCTDMTKPSPDWCDVVATPVAQLDAKVFDPPTNDHALVSRQESQQESPEKILKEQLEWCAKNAGYCESLCDTDLGFCDHVTCRNDPSRCRELFGIRCTKWGGPWWCWSDAPPPALEGDMTNIVEREVSDHNDAREAFCRYNPAECRKEWPSQCVGNKEDVPSWCDSKAAPPALEGEMADIVVHDGPARDLFCRYNPAECRKKWRHLCLSNIGPVPFWCYSDAAPPASEGEPARDLYCRYNSADCRKQWPFLCVGNKENIPSWCDSKATSPALEEEMTNIVERSPQDDPEKEDPEEHEEAHPIERSWCKKHPNHPYCYSQFCRDHPGSCKVAVDSAAIPPPPPPAQVTVPATVNKDNTQSLYKRGGWWCLWLCD